MSIGEKITFFRKKKGVSQEAMAELLGMSTAGYGKIERDETDVNYSRLELIAAKLKVKPEDIVGFGEKTNHQSGNNNNFVAQVENVVYQNFTDKDLAHALEKSQQENAFFKEKISFLEEKNLFLTEKIKHLETNISNIPNENQTEKDIFWEIVVLSFKDEAQAIALLAQMPISYFAIFEEILAQKLFALDKKVLAQSIYKNRNISKDDFLYVRCFTLAQGRDFYEKVLNNKISMPSNTFEALLYLSEKAYFQKTSNEFTPILTSVSYETGSNLTFWA